MNPTGFEKVESAVETCFLQVGQNARVGQLLRESIGRESEIVLIIRVIEEIKRLENQCRLRRSPHLDVLCKAGIHVEVRISAETAVAASWQLPE